MKLQKESRTQLTTNHGAISVIGYKSNGTTVASKHGTIEQAIKVAGPQEKQAQDNRAGYKSSGPARGRQAQDNRASYKSSRPTEEGTQQYSKL